ncbi:family 78 glycoside hydrolase catalytic domain [Ferruginibacter paludis]|uniref:family 78 glycoside hydrolase catalytic domain n=1 Tax=Ferruginibacter paludis TaxID=1310417 RepID=UPI0025B2ABE3|nr:family 78 glycoside hydrolase catalytic domain [Ferruginibacter paludis]MDN3656050.1 family 78 glycoside hydrolase catalytic domain [Ferruginibacter paludis]
MNQRSSTTKQLMLPVLLMGIIFLLTNSIMAQAVIDNLRVEYTKTPIGIDVKLPRFSWQMAAPAGERNYAQTAYQLEVKDAKGVVVWNSKKIADGTALGIVYAGVPLKAATRYNWAVTAWDQKGKATKAASWFETGLMNPALSAWDGASWIGGSNEDLVLYSKYLPLFNLKYTLAIAQGSSKASIVLGANDPRLMDKNKNIFQVQNAKNQSYLKVELDVSGVDGTPAGRAKLHFYRAGYTPKDTASKAIKTFDIKTEFINSSNKNSNHRIAIKDEFGKLSVMLDDSLSFFVTEPKKESAGARPYPSFDKGAVVNLNPMGSGGDYITFGMLCDMGFSADAGQQAAFSNVTVSNIRNPANTLFYEDLAKPAYDGIYKMFTADNKSGFSIKNNAYQVDGGSAGLFVVADPSHNAMPMLRTNFATAGKKIEAARLYVTSRGIYEVYLNGKRVGEDYFNPGLTQYNVTHLYQTYDVTGMVNSGQNALGAMLGEGWWSGLLSFGTVWNHFGDRQSLLAKLVITYDDGTKDIITSNEKNWKYYNNGPVIYSSLDMGEVYDATREAAVNNWSTASYDDNKWKTALNIPLEGTAYREGAVGFMGEKENISYDKSALIGQIGENAGLYKTLVAKTVKEVSKGVFVYNMGQNFVGVPKIEIKNGKAGQKLTVRVAEVLYPDLKESGNNVGLLMTENYRAALSQDTYVMKDGEQIWQPHFTSHGYQYIEISGMDEALPLEAVHGLCISSVKKITSDYATSNEKVNKLWSNLVWSNVDNFLTIPTDCPQRNERMGWSGDISVFSRTATYLSNADQFLRRHMFAMRDVQTPKGKFTDVAPVGGGFGGLLWGSAGITVAWEAYQQYNDIALLQEHYAAMVTYINYLDSCIDKTTGLCTDRQLGDWLGPQNNQLGTDFLVTVYHIFDLDIMTKVAVILNNKNDAARFKKMYDERKMFFNKTFVNVNKKAIGLIGGGMFGSAGQKQEWKVADVQTAYAVGLALNAFNEENIPFMVKNLKQAVERKNTGDDGIERPNYSLMTGFIGTAWVSKALSDYGNSDLAYKLLQNNQFPSWLYAVDQGATSIWERLNGYTTDKGFGGNNSMNSFNHYSFGAIGQWMMAYSLGIQRDELGFKKFILQPEPDPTGEMTWARGYYDSDYGRISSSWKMEKGVLTYTATVPANTTATLYLPAKDIKNIKEGGKPAANSQGVKFIRFDKGKAVYALQSGTYEFTVPQ